MANDINIIISADGRKLDQAINRSGKIIHAFGEKSIGVFNRMGRAMQRVGDTMMTPFASIASAAGIAIAGKSVIDFDARLARLAIQAGKSKKEMYELKDTLFSVGKETFQPPQELLAAIEQIVEKTGDYDLAVGSLKGMGYAGSASAAAMADIGALTSNLNEKLGITKTQMKGAFDILIEQGKTGAFTLQKMAGMGERLFTAAGSWGVKGVQGLREFGAFLQIVRRGSGNEEQATTATERTIADMIQNRNKIKALTGFSIIDPERSRQAGRTVMKDFGLVIKEIVKRTKGDQIKLRAIFNEESIRAMNSMAMSYAKFGDFREFDDLASRGGDGTQMMKDFAFWTGMSKAKVEEFRTTLLKFSNDNLQGPIEGLTKALDVLNRHPIITKGGIYAILGLGGAITIKRVWDFLRDVFQPSGSKTQPGKGGLPGISGAKAGIPVYVTNWPGGGMPKGTVLDKHGNPFPTSTGEKTPGKPGALKTGWEVAKTAGKFALPFTLPGAAILATIAYEEHISTPEMQEQGKKQLALAAQVDAHMRAVSARNNPVAKPAAKVVQAATEQTRPSVFSVPSQANTMSRTEAPQKNQQGTKGGANSVPLKVKGDDSRDRLAAMSAPEPSTKDRALDELLKGTGQKQPNRFTTMLKEDPMLLEASHKAQQPNWPVILKDAVKNEIHINVDNNGRAIVDSNNKTNTDVHVNRGRF